MKVSIKGLNKPTLLAGLYNNAKMPGMGFFGQRGLGDKAGKPMSVHDAELEIAKLRNNLSFDYLHGKVMKIDISKDEVDTFGYNRDNGADMVEKIIAAIRENKPVENLLAESEDRAEKIKKDLQQNPDQVVRNNQIRIIALVPPMEELGKESELTDKNFRRIDVNTSFSGKINSFPKLNANEKLVCAFNQFGMKGMAKMIACHSVEQMQELYDKYSQGWAITIDWFVMTDKKLENTDKKESSNKNLSGLFANLNIDKDKIAQERKAREESDKELLNLISSLKKG